MENFIGKKVKYRSIVLIGILVAAFLTPRVAIAANIRTRPGGQPEQTSSDFLLSPNTTTPDELIQAYSRLPFGFESHAGRTATEMEFVARTDQYTLFLGPAEVLIFLPASGSRPAIGADQLPPDYVKAESRPPHIVRLQLMGSNPNAAGRGQKLLSGRINYFLGDQPQQWQSNIRVYSRVKYSEVYPGVDLVFYGNRGDLEFDFIVAPGARPDIIKMVFDGVEKLQLNDSGDLLLLTANWQIKLHQPFIYQDENGGRRQIPGKYVIENGRHVGLQIASYNSHKPLIIDPKLHYSTFLGGEGSERAYDIALDDDGNVLVIGSTSSVNFPLKNPVRDNLLGDQDVFVTKFNPSLSQVFYSSYVGGSGHERGYAISVDRDGNAYLTGLTRSINFPLTDDALDKTCGSDGFCNPDITDVSISQRTDAFVTKLDPAGNLVYSTYLGGGDSDHARAIAVDGIGSIYVAGATGSRDFPITPAAFQTECAGGNPLVNFCNWDAFITKINPLGSEIIYSTFFGGPGRDEIYDIVLENDTGFVSAVYTAGLTGSGRDFPATPGAVQSAHANSTDGFVMKLNALGSNTIYATALGGTESEWINSVAKDDQGYAYVVGTTYSPDFPTTPGAFDTACGTDGNCDSTGEGYWLDAFVAKINPTGTALAFSTYLGGINKEFGLGIAVQKSNGDNQAYVTGQTLSPDFPVLNPVQGTYGEAEHTGGSGDVFVTRFNADGSSLIYSTYLGGRGPDGGWGIMIDGSGNAYLAGFTTSDDFPATLGAYQPDLQNPVYVRGDAFVARIGEGFLIPPLDLFWQILIYLAVVTLAALVFYRWQRIFSK